MRVTPSMLSGYSRVNSYQYLTSAAKSSKSIGKKTAASSVYGRTGSYASTVSAKAYADLNKQAQTLRDSSSILSSQSKNNIFEYSKRTGTRDELLSQVKSMVEGYNGSLKDMKSSGSSTDRIYSRMLENASDTYSSDLAKAGITVNKDKTLSINEKTFKDADISDIEGALGSKSGFTDRMEYVSGNVARTAAYNSGQSIGRYSGYNSLANALSGSMDGFYNNNVYNAHNYLSSFMGNRFGF